MKFVDCNDDRIYSFQDMKADYIGFKQDEPWNHAETFKAELLEIILATVNGRNDLEILDMTPDEISRLVNRLRKEA